MPWNAWLTAYLGMPLRVLFGASNDRSGPHRWCGVGGIGGGLAVLPEAHPSGTLGDATGAFDAGTPDPGLRGAGLLELAEVRQREHRTLGTERRNAAGGIAAVEHGAGMRRTRRARA